MNEIPFSNKLNTFSSLRKLQVVFNLKRKVSSKTLFSSYFSKKLGSNYVFKLPDFYLSLRCQLFNLSFLPYSEVFLNRFSIGFRPFRSDYDTFCLLKNNIVNSKDQILYSGFKRFQLMESNFLINDFSLNKLFLVSWLKRFRSIEDSFSCNISGIINSVINYSVSGLVLFEKLLISFKLKYL